LEIGDTCRGRQLRRPYQSHRDRLHQRLESENQGVHERKGVDDVKPNGPQGAIVFCDNDVVIVGIGDAAAAWRGAV